MSRIQASFVVRPFVVQATIVAAAASLAGCQSTTPPAASLPRGLGAYTVVPPASEVENPHVRVLRPGDAIAVDVFREDALSVDKLVIDDTGLIQLPLIGELRAAGSSATDLSETIRARLAARYLRNPQVTVTVIETVPRSMTVEGLVTSPGVFPISRDETLLTALARAKSPVATAKLNEVVVFRTVNERRMGAVFDLKEIRSGRAPDPQIVDGDIVVVGFSEVKGAFRDFLQAAPLLNLFAVF